MNSINKYFKDKQELTIPATDKEIIDLEKRLEVNFPDDYKLFLKEVNGFEGEIGESYVRLVGVSDIEEYTTDYCADFYPDKICIGTNGGGELFVIDKRNEKAKYGFLPAIGDMEDYIELGDTFDKFISRLSEGIF